jgi:membrane fusion protein, multidrug efflux system
MTESFNPVEGETDESGAIEPLAETDSVPGTATEPEKRKAPLWRRMGLLLVVPLLLLGIGGYFWLISGRYVSTDNAYVQRDMVSVASPVSGTIVAVHVTENQQVQRGDLLFELDDRPFRVALQQANAQIAEARVQIAELQARSSGTQGDITGAQANLTFAERNLARYQSLMDRGFLSRVRYDDAVHEVAEARERLANARAEAQSARAALAQGGISAQPALQAALAAREAALLNLEYTRVRAPADGYVTQADRAQVGSIIVGGVPVVTIVRSDALWVEANFKETDLTNMFVGQPAEIEFDAYPDIEVRGHVASIGVGTGSEFSLLPAQNASGNWVKVTQRVPVRIAIDSNPGRPLIAGLSVNAIVDTRERPARSENAPAAAPR